MFVFEGCILKNEMNKPLEMVIDNILEAPACFPISGDVLIHCALQSN